MVLSKRIAVNVARFMVIFVPMGVGGAVGAWLADLLIGVPAAAPRSIVTAARDDTPLILLVPLVGMIAGFIAGVELWKRVARRPGVADSEIL